MPQAQSYKEIAFLRIENNLRLISSLLVFRYSSADLDLFNNIFNFSSEHITLNICLQNDTDSPVGLS